MGRSTLKDVALKAGVSVATASNVINNKTGQVSEKTASKVLAIAKQLGYQKDLNAVSLKTGNSNMVVVLTPAFEHPDPFESLLIDSPFFSDFLAGIECGATALGLYFSFMRITNVQQLEVLRGSARPAGVIVIGKLNHEVLAAIATWDFNTLIVDDKQFFKQYSPSQSLINYSIDDFTMAKIATDHLLELGHRRILLLFGPLNLSEVHTERFNSARTALKSAGLTDDDYQLIETNVTTDGARQVFTQIQQGIEQGATAVLCMSDILAIGCYRQLSQCGLKVPEDISLIGMDNLRILKYLPFQLTTVSQDITKRGYQAVQQLKDANLTNSIELRLIKGDTTTRANAADH